MKFKVGDKVVYPNHGIGVVKEIKDQEIRGERATFISLQILASDSTVMVPLRNSDTVGLRKLVSKAKVREVLDRLRAAQVEVPTDWKGRFQDSQDKMRSGDLEQVAIVLKNLTYLNSLKPLSYRERKVLDRARALVVSELAEAGRIDAPAAERLVDEAMADVLGAAAAH
ncbi:MAG TPA: CarD family transcriptional regulator [Acidobacteriota bacterium]|nr:CarD family transcriptional regulator [bacterium]HNX20621.1 CarD family transcriptional regulator [Acidobacteriota bacterium]